MIKKILIVFLILFQFQKVKAQDRDPNLPNRAEVVVNIFEELYGKGKDPYNFPAASFPSTFYDLQPRGILTDSAPYAILLSYLEFGDGVPVVDRGMLIFDSPRNVNKIEFIRQVLEAWDIKPSKNKTLPYKDFPDANMHPEFGYVRKAYELDLLPNSTRLYPYDFITYNFMRDFFDDLNDYKDPPSLSELKKLDNYFIPNNYQPNNIGMLRGLEQGVLSHYAKNSFVIPDIQMSLNFSHFYSTSMVELPESYFPVQPLTRGWSHTYNIYAQRQYVDTDGDDNDEEIYYITWADGTIHIWNETESEWITEGVYSDANAVKISGVDNLMIWPKSNSQFRFAQLDDDLEIFYLIKISDKNGNDIEIEYESADADDMERIEKVISPSGKELEFFYHDNTDFIDYIEDPIGRQIRFTFNEERLKYFYDAKDHETKYYYVSNDEDEPEDHQYKRFLLKKIRLPRGNKIEAEFDKDDNGKLTKYKINDNDPVEIDTEFNYDEKNVIESTVTVPLPNGKTQNFDYKYNKHGSLTYFKNKINELEIVYPKSGPNVTLPTNSNLDGLDVEYEYDSRGNLTDVIIEGEIEHRYRYNDDNTLDWYKNPNGYYTHFGYEDGNLTSIKDPLGNSIIYTYDRFGQIETVTNQEGITVNYVFEPDGVVSSISAPEGIHSSFIYDEVNRLKSRNNNGLNTSYLYDPNDNLISQTNTGGYTTTFDYNENDNLTEIINAKGVKTIFSYFDDKDLVQFETFDKLIKEYDYNDDGSLEYYKKPSGKKIEYDYTENGQFNKGGTITDIDYEDGLLKEIASKDTRYTFGYNRLNRVDKIEDSFNNSTIKYDYDDVGNIEFISYPLSKSDLKIRYRYDKKNRLWKIFVQTNGEENLAVEYGYLKDDRISGVKYINSISNIYFYDDAGRKNRIYYSDNQFSLYEENFSINERGNITLENKTYAQPKPEVNLETTSSSYSYNNNNHIKNAGDIPITVNDDGNTIKKGNLYYEYDIDDRLVKVIGHNGKADVHVEYKYDAYGNRIEKNVLQGATNPVKTRYVWDILNNNVIKEYNPDANEQLFYVYGTTGLEFSVNPDTGEIDKFFHGDIRGSVVFSTDISGNIIGDNFIKYDDFGNIINNINTESESFSNFHYLGKHGIISDITTDNGLYYVKARYYDAELGRFLTQDPIWSTNLYPYANNNPISNIDVNGENWEDVVNWYNSYSQGIYSGLEGEYFLTAYQNCETISNPGTCRTGKWVGFSGAIIGEIGAAISSNPKKLFVETPSKLTRYFGKTGRLKLFDMRRKFGRHLKSADQFLKEKWQYYKTGKYFYDRTN